MTLLLLFAGSSDSGTPPAPTLFYAGGDLPPELVQPTWEVLLQRFDGTQLIPLTKLAGGWSFFVSLNGLGWFNLPLHRARLAEVGYPDDIPLDSLVEFMFSRSGKKKGFSFYKRKVKRTQNLIEISGRGLNFLLGGRTTGAYSANTTYTVKTLPLDDMVKQIVRENCGDEAVIESTGDPDTERDYSQVIGFSVAENTSGAETHTLSFADDNVYETLVKIANLSTQDGTRLFFQVERPNDTTFKFETRLDCYGKDRRGIRTFGVENGSMRDTEFMADHSDEITYIYVAGQNPGALRERVPVSNPTALNASPLNRRELTRDARNTATENLESVGYQELEARKAVRSFDGELIDAEGARYALDWDLGDILDAKDGEDEFEIMITGVRFDNRGGEDVAITGQFVVIG